MRRSEWFGAVEGQWAKLNIVADDLAGTRTIPLVAKEERCERQ